MSQSVEWRGRRYEEVEATKNQISALGYRLGRWLEDYDDSSCEEAQIVYGAGHYLEIVADHLDDYLDKLRQS